MARMHLLPLLPSALNRSPNLECFRALCFPKLQATGPWGRPSPALSHEENGSPQSPRFTKLNHSLCETAFKVSPAPEPWLPRALEAPAP